MKNTLRSLVAGFLMFLTAVPAGAVDTRRASRDAVAGQEIRLVVHSDYGQDCKGEQKPQIIITRQVKHGTITLKHSIEEVNRPGTPCHGKSIPGIGIFYTANPGYSGSDRLTYKRNASNGQTIFKVDFKITVH